MLRALSGTTLIQLYIAAVVTVSLLLAVVR
jgi:hypothetical protein